MRAALHSLAPGTLGRIRRPDMHLRIDDDYGGSPFTCSAGARLSARRRMMRRFAAPSSAGIKPFRNGSSARES
jgi:hypothetical protein